MHDKFGDVESHVNMPLADLPPAIKRLDDQFRQQEM